MGETVDWGDERERCVQRGRDGEGPWDLMEGLLMESQPQVVLIGRYAGRAESD